MTNYCLVIIINVKEVPGAQLWIIFISVVQQPCSLPSHGSNIDIIFPCLSSFPWTKSHITRVEKCFFFLFLKAVSKFGFVRFFIQVKNCFFFLKAVVIFFLQPTISWIQPSFLCAMEQHMPEAQSTIHGGGRGKPKWVNPASQSSTKCCSLTPKKNNNNNLPYRHVNNSKQHCSCS